MEGLELKYDGVVIQHAAEILIPDFTDTIPIRCHCAASYVWSLRNFVFGEIFGSKLITNAELPEVGTEKPGETLLTESAYFSKKHERRPTPRRVGAEELVKDPEDKGGLKPLLRSLGTLVGKSEAKFWYHHMIREVFLGFKPADNDWPKNDEGLFLFSNRENFYPNKDKEDAVDDIFVEFAKTEICAALGDIEESRKAPKGALPGYIRRNVVAHVAIHPVINREPDRDLDPTRSARVFHATRSSLTEIERTLWKVRDITIPGLLDTMIEAAAREQKPRATLLDMLKDASENPNFDPIRTKLALAVALARTGDQRELNKLVTDLRASLPAGSSPEVRSLLIGVEDQAYRNAIATLRESGAGPKRDIINESWFIVFPELQITARPYVQKY